MTAPDVAIVIPARNAAATLPRLLGACAAQDFDGSTEVVVVDDGSTDGTRRAAEAAGARVISQKNRGPAAARNRGWRETQASIVLFTDSDCVPRPDWVRRLVAGLDETHAVACGSYGIANPGNLLAETVHAEIRWRHSRLRGDVQFAGSYNLGVRRSALERVDGFDESYASPSAEDNDLSYRLTDAGLAIRFVPDALVDHNHPTRLGRYLREQARHGFWRVVLYAAHPGRTRGDDYAGVWDLAAPPLAVLSVGFALASPFWREARAIAPLCLVFVLVIHHFLALRVARLAGSSAALALAPIGTLRAYARGWGMLRGIVHVLTRGRR